jgi:hypothetical protein
MRVARGFENRSSAVEERMRSSWLPAVLLAALLFVPSAAASDRLAMNASSVALADKFCPTQT